MSVQASRFCFDTAALEYIQKYTDGTAGRGTDHYAGWCMSEAAIGFLCQTVTDEKTAPGEARINYDQTNEQ